MPKGSAGGLGSGPSTAFGGRGFGGGPLGQPAVAGGGSPEFGGGPAPQFQPPGMGGQPGLLGPPDQAFPQPQPPLTPPPALDGGLSMIQPQPSMPAGIPPQPPTIIQQPPASSLAGTPGAPRPQKPSADRTGGAPVNGPGPASIGMSPSAGAQQSMMNRAGVKPPPRKPAPVSQVPPKPLA